MWLPPGSVIARCVIPWRGLRFAHLQGCWRNGHQRPVLKHGPRSRLRMRVFGCQTPTRKEGELCLCRVKPEETLVEARSGSDVQIDRQTWAWGRKTNRTF